MYLIDDTVWQDYKDIINGIHEDFNQEDITWLRSRGGLDRHGEDNETERFTSINIKGLFQYNYNRSWPITKFSEAGSLDLQSQLLILNIEYLRTQGYINANGNFDYDQAADRFIHQGIRYIAQGDSLISQAKDEPLLVMIILSRETIETGKKTN